MEAGERDSLYWKYLQKHWGGGMEHNLVEGKETSLGTIGVGVRDGSRNGGTVVLPYLQSSLV